MMDMIKIGLIGIVGVLVAVSLKSYKAEYGVYVGAAVCLVILGYALRYFAGIMSAMEQLQGYLKDNYSYITILMKTVGVTYACEFCSGICKDAGYSGIAGQVEMIGKLVIGGATLNLLPILMTLIESIQSLAG